MLRADVVEAVAAGTFNVYPVTHVDQAMELLTGMPAGERDPQGDFPADSLNGRICERLIELAEQRRSFGGNRAKNGESNDEGEDDGGEAP
jgi:predicted ATP-dependent protease